MMEEPEHTLNPNGIRRYKALYKDRRPIENGNVVRISTDIALCVMMSGYDDFLDRNDYEKDRMTERTLCDGRKMTNLPQYVFGIVVQGTVDATNDNFLQFFEIDLFGELLLRNYGIDCVCNHTFWEYDVQLAKGHRIIHVVIFGSFQIGIKCFNGIRQKELGLKGCALFVVRQRV